MDTKHGNDAIAWSDAFVLGYGPMDDVHEEFVTLVRAMQQACDDELAGLLETFDVHAKAHFDAENAWMVETDFPARECHIDEHAAVLRSVQQVRERLARGDHAVVRRLAGELAWWFPGHADYLDSALAHWMCKHRLGGKPVVLRRNLGQAYMRSMPDDRMSGLAEPHAAIAIEPFQPGGAAKTGGKRSAPHTGEQSCWSASASRPK